MSWEETLQRQGVRFLDAQGLVLAGNAAYGAGLCALMLARREEAAEWLRTAAESWRASFADAPPESWGRPIGAVKARILAGDWERAAGDARWALEAGAGETASQIGRYAAALACAVLGDWEAARIHADYARTHEAFPDEVADALAFVAAEDVVGYAEAVEDVLESFETRDEYLEDVPVADTVLVLQALAARRGMAAELASPLLPG